MLKDSSYSSLFCEWYDIVLQEEAKSISTIVDSLNTFIRLLYLQINHAKSLIFLSAMDKPTKEWLVAISSFQMGTLLVRYLGAPFVFSRLSIIDYACLVEITTCWISHWTSRFLSYAGCLQIANFVLFAIQAYWSMRFILSFGIYKKIEKLLARFL